MNMLPAPVIQLETHSHKKEETPMRDTVHKKQRYIVMKEEHVKLYAWRLAAKVVAEVETFKPNFLLALWRGGAQVGVYMHEYLKRKGIDVDHVCIRTSSYTAPGAQSSTIDVHTLRYVVQNVSAGDRVLIVDDIFDSGRSLEAVINKLRKKIGDDAKMPSIRIATMWWKPEKNKTDLKPDYFVENKDVSDAWIVMPHEISDFTDDSDLRAIFGDDVADMLASVDE